MPEEVVERHVGGVGDIGEVASLFSRAVIAAHLADAFTRLKWLEHGNVLDPYEVVNVPLNEVVRVLWSEMIETIKRVLS